LALTLLPASKSSLWLKPFASPGFERLLKFHKQLGRVVLVAASIHLALSLDMVRLSLYVCVYICVLLFGPGFGVD
jgi:hypothetical protein